MKNTHGEVLLLVKLQASVLHASGQQLYLKRRSGTGGGVFLCEIFSSNIFTEQLRTTNSLWTTNSRTILLLNKNRSGRSQMFFKIGVLKNFASFTGKHWCWSLLLREFTTLLKKTPTQVLCCEIFKLLRTFFYRTVQVAASLTRAWNILWLFYLLVESFPLY